MHVPELGSTPIIGMTGNTSPDQMRSQPSLVIAHNLLALFMEIKDSDDDEDMEQGADVDIYEAEMVLQKKQVRPQSV